MKGINKILLVGLSTILFIYASFTHFYLAFAVTENEITNATRVYFNGEITKTYGNGDCILLENYDANGNKIYGLIDAGRKITKKDGNDENSTVVKEFLKNHGVSKLNFFLITHSHGDHNGDALTVLDNFEVEKIYMKEFDITYSLTGDQSGYEKIVSKAIDKGIKVIGVSYLSLISPEISPGRSASFIETVKSAKRELFEGFTENNTQYKFGSANIQIINWEMFSEDGSQYITGSTTDKTREIDENENNNSLGVLLTQGKKKAFFAGDINNLDENKEKGRIGDEDRIKHLIGEVDFLKLGHHGYNYSNTESYLNVLNPKYAVITNDIGGAYKNTIEWIDNKKINYLYTTIDEYGISATITSNDIYLGLETEEKIVTINDELYYIPKGDKYKDYTKYKYTVNSEEENHNVSSWSELKELIDSNKKSIRIDNNKKTITLNKLILNLQNSDNWTADSEIEISNLQKIVLTSSEDIKILRGSNLIKDSLFKINGSLDLGTDNMNGSITLDGNKDNVISSSTLLNITSGKLNIYDGITLSNNMNTITSRVNNSSTQSYSAFGSAIYAYKGTINMYGGTITNNSQNVKVTYTMPEKMYNFYDFSSNGSGVYIISDSTFNMYGGSITGNDAENNSDIYTRDTYSYSYYDRGFTQNINGVGIYASNSNVNLLGGRITNNTANNKAKLTLVTPTTETMETNIYSAYCGIYGVGVFVNISSNLNISNKFEISNNKALNNSIINVQEKVKVRSVLTTATRGLNVYSNDSNVNINDAIVSNGIIENNMQITNNGKIGPSGTGNVNTDDLGGGVDLVSSKFSITKLSVSNCSSVLGGGLFATDSNGTISDSSFTNNNAKLGGGIHFVDNTEIIKLNNIKATENRTINGSGGGIYANGDVEISGANTLISNNVSDTYGGGIMIKKLGILTDGVITGNRTLKYAGGGIRVDGKLIVNGGSITNNNAKTTGGGIDYTTGKVYYNSGTIQNNTAEREGNEIYPISENLADLVAPEVSLSEIPDTWTNKDINITIKATDDAGIRSVTVNDVLINKKNNDSYIYEVSSNGTYKVVVTDNSGNKNTKEFTIAKLDKNIPIITGVSNNGIYNEPITITAKDSLSGIKSVELEKDGQRIEYNLGDTLTLSGNYNIKVIDNANNENIINFVIDRSLLNSSIIIEGISKDWVNTDQTITISFTQEITELKVNNKIVELVGDKYSFVATENASYILEITDFDGNIIKKTINVENIDKNAPSILGITDSSVYHEAVKLFFIDEESGIKEIEVKKDQNIKKYKSKEIVLDEYGNYEVSVIDNAGNKTTKKFIIEQLKEKEPSYNNDNIYPGNGEDLNNTNNSYNGSNTMVENPQTGKFIPYNLLIIVLVMIIPLIFVIHKKRILYKI